MKKEILLPILFLSTCQTTLPTGNGEIDASLFPDPVAIHKPFQKRQYRPIEFSSISAADLICEFEGFRPSAYVCSGGKKTIGYGFTAQKYLDMGRLSESQSRAILTKELIPKYANTIDRYVKTELTERQKIALISFCYNLGEGALSNIAARINRGDRQGAANAMLLYTKARNKKGQLVELEGLVKRRQREAELFLTEGFFVIN